MDLKELNKTINYLNELKRIKQEEKKKLLNELKEEIKKEILRDIEKTLNNFESQKIIEFNERNGKKFGFSFDYEDFFESIQKHFFVDVWEW